MTPEFVLSGLDHFLVRFFDDSIDVWDKGTIETVIANFSEGSMTLSDAAIMDGLKAWERDGRLVISDREGEFIRLNQAYWTHRVDG